MKALALALLLVASPAVAEDLQEWHMVVSPFGFGLYYLPQLAFFEKLGHINDITDISMGPTDGVTIDLGRPEAPWDVVYAREYVAGGHQGMTGGVNLGNGCVLRFQSGLLVGVQGGSYFQPCAQP